MKCIKQKCPYYFESDGYYEVCQLSEWYAFECKVYDNIPDKIEEVACEIGKLQVEYNRLIGLQDYIKDNQQGGRQQLK